MRKAVSTAILIIAIATPAFAGKIKGSTTLKDFQPFGVKDKQHKHQAYDLIFDAEGKSYTCRTDSKNSTNATDFAVGSQIKYEIDKQKVKMKTPQDKEVECKVVRVENAASATPVPK